MTSKQCVEKITSGHFLYWNILGGLSGIKNNKEKDLMWLSGGIDYNYFTSAIEVNSIVTRMKNNEIPHNLLFITEDMESDPTEPFKASKLFKNGLGTIGMAHELQNASFTNTDKRLELSAVHDKQTLKSAGAILNTVFEYNLFSYEHFCGIMKMEQIFIYIAEWNGLPVGACMCQHGDDFINISWVGTLLGYRRLGIAGYLIQMAEQDGLVCGKSLSVMNAREGAVGAYRRIGYEQYCRAIELELIK